MATQTGKRLFLPGTFFEGGKASVCQRDTGESGVHALSIHPGRSVQTDPACKRSGRTAPADAQIPFTPNAGFIAKYRGAGTIYKYGRRVRVANILYQPQDYAPLRDFFQKVSAQDQTQLVVRLNPTTAAAGAPGGKE